MSTRTFTTTLIRRAILTLLALGGLVIATASARAQDHVVGPRGAGGGDTKTRNDLTFAAGITVRF